MDGGDERCEIEEERGGREKGWVGYVSKNGAMCVIAPAQLQGSYLPVNDKPISISYQLHSNSSDHSDRVEHTRSRYSPNEPDE